MRPSIKLINEQFHNFINFPFLKLVIEIVVAMDKIVPKLVLSFKYYEEYLNLIY